MIYFQTKDVHGFGAYVTVVVDVILQQVFLIKSMSI